MSVARSTVVAATARGGWQQHTPPRTMLLWSARFPPEVRERFVDGGDGGRCAGVFPGCQAEQEPGQPVVQFTGQARRC
jgi:hypothetical protein